MEVYYVNIIRYMVQVIYIVGWAGVEVAGLNTPLLLKID